MNEKIQALIAAVQKELGTRAVIQSGRDILWQSAERLRTGSLGLDVATNGGIPRGMVTQFMGEESGGKTTMALKVAGQVQENFQDQAAIAWVAVEPFDKMWANQCGCSVPFTPEEIGLAPADQREWMKEADEIGMFVVGQATNGEDALELALRFLESGQFQLVVVDSLAALTPSVEQEGEMQDQTMGQQPRLINKFLRKCYSAFNTRLENGDPNQTALILINQVREQIGVYGHPEPQAPGGRGLRHALALNVRFKRGELLKDGEKGNQRVFGKRTKIKVEKSKVGPPYREAEFDFYFQPYNTFEPGEIDWAQEIRLWGVRSGVITQTGNASYEVDNTKFRGKESVESWLREHPDRADQLAQLIRRTLTTAG